NRHDRLWLDGTILERINNGLLEFDLGASARANRASVWNGNVAVDVYGLRRNLNKIAGAHTRLGRDEEPTRACLKNCQAGHTALTEAEISRAAPLRKFPEKPGRRPCQYAGAFGRKPD